MCLEIISLYLFCCCGITKFRFNALAQVSWWLARASTFDPSAILVRSLLTVPQLALRIAAMPHTNCDHAANKCHIVGCPRANEQEVLNISNATAVLPRQIAGPPVAEARLIRGHAPRPRLVLASSFRIVQNPSLRHSHVSKEGVCREVW